MNIYLMITTLLANIIAIAIIYQFIKKLENKKKLIFIAISIALMYILISIVYWISGFGVDKNIHEASKNFVLYLFVPVNLILFVPYFATQYIKLKFRKIKIEKFINKTATLIVLLIVVLIAEYFYFKNIQENINTMKDSQNAIKNNEIEVQNEIENQNTIVNEIISNEVENQNVFINENNTNEI